MTIYVFDSGPLITLFRHYYLSRFPTLWQQFHTMVSDNLITSTREVWNELKGQEDMLARWCNNNRQVFVTPTSPELDVVREIFNVQHFQSIIEMRRRLEGRAVADPFVIARAKCLQDSYVVTSEKLRPNAAKIPNICNHFGVNYTDLEGFMVREGWEF